MNRRDSRATVAVHASRAAIAVAAILALVALPTPVRADTPPAEAVRAVRAKMDTYRCYVCHADDEPKAGPAFADVAAAYRKARDPVDTMATVIRTGKRSGGPWHMPPHPETSPADARAIARYILALPPPLPAPAPAPAPAVPTSKTSP